MNTKPLSERITQGPWKVLHTPTRKETFWAVATTNDAPVQAVIALVDGVSFAHKECPDRAQANAELIALAPTLLAQRNALLAACKAIVSKSYLRDGPHEDCQVHPALIDQARQAIASVEKDGAL